MGTSNKFLIDIFISCSYAIDEIKETIEALNDCLDDSKEVYFKKIKEKYKDIENHPAFFIL